MGSHVGIVACFVGFCRYSCADSDSSSGVRRKGGTEKSLAGVCGRSVVRPSEECSKHCLGPVPEQFSVGLIQGVQQKDIL